MQVLGLHEDLHAATKFNKPIEIAYTADTKLSDFVRLLVKNRHFQYQSEFKCVFTQENTIGVNDMRTKSVKMTSNWQFKWRQAQTSASSELNMNSFDCSYSPYASKWLRPDVALQKVYFSLWWLTSANDWNQVKIESDEDDLHQSQNYLGTFNVFFNKYKFFEKKNTMKKFLVQVYKFVLRYLRIFFEYNLFDLDSIRF